MYLIFGGVDRVSQVFWSRPFSVFNKTFLKIGNAGFLPAIPATLFNALTKCSFVQVNFISTYAFLQLLVINSYTLVTVIGVVDLCLTGFSGLTLVFY